MVRTFAPRLALVAVGFCALAACGSPSLNYDAGAGPEADASPDARASDDASPSDAAAPLDGEPAGDASGDGGVDAIDEGRTDAASDGPVNPPDAGHDSGIDCDQDHDGYKAVTCEGGTDCCDNDSNAHPGQTMFFTSQDGCLNWDYNCDGKVETEITVNIKCTGTGLTGCNGGPGFTSSPACGAMAPYSTCVGSGALACTASSNMMATQACN